MALLKSLIQRLLDSRTTPDEAANCAMPEGSKQDITPSIMSESIAWQRMHNGVAVDNGYIQAEGRGATAGKSQLMIGQDPNDFRSFSNTFEATGLNVCFAPVKKGQVYYVYGSNLTNLAIYFFKSVGNSAIVGGGYNRLVRRALSCLRPSFNCLPRSFCKAKSLGLQNNQLLLSIRALIFLVQAPLISLPTPLRATAGRLLGAIQLQSQLLKSKSRTGRWHLLPYLTETLRELESVVTLKKGHRLSSCAVAEVQPIILFGSTKQVQTFNPLTGGASC